MSEFVHESNQCQGADSGSESLSPDQRCSDGWDGLQLVMITANVSTLLMANDCGYGCLEEAAQ